MNADAGRDEQSLVVATVCHEAWFLSLLRVWLGYHCGVSLRQIVYQFSGGGYETAILQHEGVSLI